MAKACTDLLSPKVVATYTGSTRRKPNSKFTITDLCFSVTFFHNSEIKLYVIGDTVILFFYPLLTNLNIWILPKFNTVLLHKAFTLSNVFKLPYCFQGILGSYNANYDNRKEVLSWGSHKQGKWQSLTWLIYDESKWSQVLIWEHFPMHNCTRPWRKWQTLILSFLRAWPMKRKCQTAESCTCFNQTRSSN